MLYSILFSLPIKSDMKREPYRLISMVAIVLLTLQGSLLAQADGYRSPEAVEEWIMEVADSHPGTTRITVMTTSPGNRPVYLLEIGNETNKSEKVNPSVFVGANFEGTRPLATEGAIYLAGLILADPAHYDSLNWYIVPVGNPDAAANFFQDPLFEDTRNDQPTNDDRDEHTDEDGPDDLNLDGRITQMRVKHPDGVWIPADQDQRLMRKADPDKGEQGMYKLYTEGTDDDGDGQYNEDGEGGTNVNLNFPFLFPYLTEPAGLYPGSSPESYALMEFVFSHPDIAMIFSFGSTNFCLSPPKGGRKGEADLNRIRVSERQARMFNLDPSRTYSMSELVEMISSAYPGEQIDESDIAAYLGLGAALNPQEKDLVFYTKYAEEFKKYLKEQGASAERFEPEPAAGGSLELWGYFHVGVPVFSMDLWGIPKPGADSATAGKPGPEKRAGEAGKSEGLEKELALLNFSDSLLNKQGFVDWQPFDHPSLGEVEIGGFAPYAFSTPPYSFVDTLLSKQVPWVLKLAGELPDLHIYEVKVTPNGEGIYQLEAWIENRAYIPFPTAMGKRNGQPAPAVLTLGGDPVDLLSGYLRTPVRSVGGMSRVKLSWIVHTDDPAEIILNLESKTAGKDQQTIKIGG
jgi:murein tripeptide amidase MpaA